MTTETLLPQFLGVHISMIVLATLVVTGRIISRAWLTQGGLGADDYTILLTLAIAIAYIGNNLREVNYGFGRHVQDLPPNIDSIEGVKTFWIGEFLYFSTVEITKISIIFLYLRLFPTKRYRWICYGLMAFVLATLIGTLLVFIFQCQPISFNYDQKSTSGTCINQTAFFFSIAGIDIVQDVMIYVLPIPALIRLQLPWKQRITLIAVFLVGGFVILTSILRLNSLKTTTFSHDVTWDNVATANWSVIEACTGIVCASLIHYRPLISRFAPSWFKGSTYAIGTPGRKLENPSSSGHSANRWTSSHAPHLASGAHPGEWPLSSSHGNHPYGQLPPGDGDIRKTVEYDVEHGIELQQRSESSRALHPPTSAYNPQLAR